MTGDTKKAITSQQKFWKILEIPKLSEVFGWSYKHVATISIVRHDSIHRDNVEIPLSLMILIDELIQKGAYDKEWRQKFHNEVLKAKENPFE